jgi:Uma2 family endonuclease
MASYPVRRKFTEREYLTIERAAEFKSEFLDGEIYAMSGATRPHGRLQRNLLIEVHTAVRDRGCEALGSDSRVRTSDRSYFYPDVAVFCGPERTTDHNRDTSTNPTVIFEVLSPSTEKYDRDVKFRHYRTIDSLTDYLLISQEQMYIEQYTRQPDGTWNRRDYWNPEEELKIESIGVAIPLARIYDQVEFPPAEN